MTTPVPAPTVNPVVRVNLHLLALLSSRIEGAVRSIAVRRFEDGVRVVVRSRYTRHGTARFTFDELRDVGFNEMHDRLVAALADAGIK